ncbi:MAG: ABC transporter permease subunit [Rhodobacteraceae bacterium]|nr:ABC transporter permease subunit [Paracoccaceae bacterium]
MAMLLLPVIIIILFSFWKQTFLTVDHSFRLDNYRAALTQPIYRDLFLRSLWISLTVSVATVVMAYPVAWYISFHGGRNKNLWLFLITVPFLTSYLLRVMSWKLVLGYNGVLNSLLLWLGLIHSPIESLLYNADSVIITLVHSWVAFAILPIFVSLEKIDRSLVEAGQDLGDGLFRSLTKIVLPLSLPGVTSAFLIVMIPTVGDYVTPKLVGGTEGVMIASAIEVNFGRAMNWPLGAALSVTTMVLVASAAGLMVLALRLAVRGVRR